MQQLELPTYNLVESKYFEKVSFIQKYGFILLGFFLLLCALLILVFKNEGSGAIVMMVALTLVALFFIPAGFTSTHRVIDLNLSQISIQSNFGNKQIKPVKFSEISEIKSVDLTVNGAYQGRYYYYLLKENNNPQSTLTQKLSSPIVSPFDQTAFINNIHTIIFNT
jgi:hypothetical protein